MFLSRWFNTAGQIQKISSNYKLHNDKLVSRVASGGINVCVEKIFAGTGGIARNL